MNKRLRVRVLPLMLASLLASSPSFAQNTSAAMSGRVTDASGNPVAGATVDIVHVPSNTTKQVTTDAEGRFNVRGLRVGGPFIVDAEKSGLAKAERKDVYLKLAEDTTIDLTMGADAATLEAVEVTATAASTVFLADNKGLSTNVTNEQIQAFPSISRSIQDYVRLDSRIVQTDKERGEISAVGQNSR
ncbi:MAG TPA: carboxypeptidase-like regulatory domain-containing protein, partial [Tahibacter sp.]|nr:carboxypeptidase-like regulatory domain-containing protein [Tahibacter sp.]